MQPGSGTARQDDAFAFLIHALIRNYAGFHGAV